MAIKMSWMFVSTHHAHTHTTHTIYALTIGIVTYDPYYCILYPEMLEFFKQNLNQRTKESGEHSSHVHKLQSCFVLLAKPITITNCAHQLSQSPTMPTDHHNHQRCPLTPYPLTWGNHSCALSETTTTCQVCK